MAEQKKDNKIKIEAEYKASNKEIETVGFVYQQFYKYRNFRSGNIRQFGYKSFDEYIKQSRELFWNSITMEQSEDLANLGLELKIPFIRKEIIEFISRIVALNVKPKIHGDDLDAYAIKVINCMYQRWRFKNNEKVEKFWDVLYGLVNGTTCKYIGYNGRTKKERTLREYDPVKGTYRITEEDKKYWNDVESYIVPIEDIYLSKIYERNIQKQGRLIWRTQMDPDDFHTEFQNYPDHVFVQPGNMIAEDSLYFQLLGGTGVTTTDKIDVLRFYDTTKDEFVVVANGIWLNKLGKDENVARMPNPFMHKGMPFVWAINEAIDEKFAYGLSLSMKEKDPHKMLNAQFMMLMEREMRAINLPILSSDLESPEIVYKTGKVTPVGDVSAYKELGMAEASQSFFTSMNSLQSIMTSTAQGGATNIVPSVQPKSAKEISQVELMRQQAMGCALLMYYDMVRQEILLAVDTMFQFYSAKKYGKDISNIRKSLMVPNQTLTNGGIGNVNVRIVETTSNPYILFFESIMKSIQDGRKTEIIEVPAETVKNIKWSISDIELAPEKTSEIEKAMFQEFANWLMPFVQMGLVDPSKVLLTGLNKNSIHPADIVPDQVLPQILSSWQNMYTPNPQSGADRKGMTGQFQQSVTGQINGAMSRGGQGMIPNETIPTE